DGPIVQRGHCPGAAVGRLRRTSCFSVRTRPPRIRFMRSLRLAAAALLLSSFSVAPAMAQTPDTGLIGVGGDIGVFFPDEAFETTLTLDAFGEYYVTPRISVRALLGWAKPGFENQTENNFRQTRLLFNGVYNWE